MARPYLLSVLALLGVAAAALRGAEGPLDLEQALADMASRRGQYDARPLHARGPQALAALLDHLLPETAPPTGVKDEDKAVHALIAQLGHDDFRVREQATLRLIAVGKPHRALVEKAAGHDDAEVRQRAGRVLDAWQPPTDEQLYGYREGLSAYLNGVKDPDRLDLLAERALAGLQKGMPEGVRLELYRQLLAMIARAGQDRHCDKLLPLLDHKDVQVGVLAVNTIGGTKGSNEFFPRLLLDALDTGRDPIIGAALDWTPNCWDRKKVPEVRKRLDRLFATGSEGIKFQACFPLMHGYRDAAAFRHLLEQTQSPDPKRARTAMYWVGDSCNAGRAVTAPILEKLVPHLTSPNEELRRAAGYALGIYQGEKVVQSLLPLLADPVPIIAEETSRHLLDQRDKKMLQRVLEGAARNHSNGRVRGRAKELLAKMQQPE
jgi:HEAT repeat protein